MDHIRLVYFSSSTENTKRFVDKLGFESERIPLRKADGELLVSYKYVLFVPTYGGGEMKNSVPKQVIKFLNVESNRVNCVGVVAAGNVNFGAAYLLAGKVISKKLKIPFLYGFELLGTADDVQKVQEGLRKVWAGLISNKSADEQAEDKVISDV